MKIALLKYLQRSNLEQSALYLLIILAFLFIFAPLGLKPLWTQEGRWAMVTWTMQLQHDYLHPYLLGKPYYDKPLLSYWLVLFAAKIAGGINTWTLRIPSALAAVITLFAIYQLNKRWFLNIRTAIISVFLLLSTYYFLFWARIASADLLNLAAIYGALAWYVAKRQKSTFSDYLIFFTILAVGSLTKGLIAPAMTGCFILPDLCLNWRQRWEQHVNLKIILALILAIAIYLLPFILSNVLGNNFYQSNGLWQVFRENILRYFQPFDHEGPIWLYIIYLPLYLLPWTIFFIPALVYMVRHWRTQSANLHWAVLALGCGFIFLTISGSRRSYYILPLVPIALSITAFWLNEITENFWRRGALWIFILVGIVYLLEAFAIPTMNASQHSELVFTKTIRQQAIQNSSWENWQIVSIHALPKTIFYLRSPNPVLASSLEQLSENLKRWLPHKSLVIVTRDRYVPKLRKIIPDTYILISTATATATATKSFFSRFMKNDASNRQTAILFAQKKENKNN